MDIHGKLGGASMSSPPTNYTPLFGNQEFAASAWNPLEFAHRWNEQAFATYSTIGSELQDFIARRLNEDFALMRRVSHCRAPHELVGAYADFWRKAPEDYGKEATMVTKLMMNATNEMVVAGQTAAKRQKVMPAPLREAAE